MRDCINTKTEGTVFSNPFILTPDQSFRFCLGGLTDNMYLANHTTQGLCIFSLPPMAIPPGEGSTVNFKPGIGQIPSSFSKSVKQMKDGFATFVVKKKICIAIGVTTFFFPRRSGNSQREFGPGRLRGESSRS